MSSELTFWDQERMTPHMSSTFDSRSYVALWSQGMKFSFQFSYVICIAKRLSLHLAIMRRHFLSCPPCNRSSLLFQTFVLANRNHNHILANDNPSVPIRISVFGYRTLNLLPDDLLISHVVEYSPIDQILMFIPF
jgi:hypothetical protein